MVGECARMKAASRALLSCYTTTTMQTEGDIFVIDVRTTTPTLECWFGMLVTGHGPGVGESDTKWNT